MKGPTSMTMLGSPRINLDPSAARKTLIEESWKRARNFGLNPDTVQVSAIDDSAFERDELFQAATKVINATASTLDDTNTWISFANSRGAVTYQWAANTRFKKQLDSINVVQGAVISEDCVGPSGVSIALASNESVIVHGDEHFNERWRSLVCAASPVIHPMTNQVVGAVNITCPAREENKHLKIALKTLVNGFQQILASGMRSQQRRMLDAHLKTKHITKRPILTLDENTLIHERELEALHLTHSAVIEFLRSLSPETRHARLPNGCKVTIVRHPDSENDQIVSLIFDEADVFTQAKLSQLPDTSRENGSQLKLLEIAERDTILATLLRLDGNKSLAADLLGVSRGTLYERIRKYNLTDFI